MTDTSLQARPADFVSGVSSPGIDILEKGGALGGPVTFPERRSETLDPGREEDVGAHRSHGFFIDDPVQNPAPRE